MGGAQPAAEHVFEEEKRERERESACSRQINDSGHGEIGQFSAKSRSMRRATPKPPRRPPSVSQHDDDILHPEKRRLGTFLADVYFHCTLEFIRG